MMSLLTRSGVACEVVPGQAPSKASGRSGKSPLVQAHSLLVVPGKERAWEKASRALARIQTIGIMVRSGDATWSEHLWRACPQRPQQRGQSYPSHASQPQLALTTSNVLSLCCGEGSAFLVLPGVSISLCRVKEPSPFVSRRGWKPT